MTGHEAGSGQRFVEACVAAAAVLSLQACGIAPPSETASFTPVATASESPTQTTVVETATSTPTSTPTHHPSPSNGNVIRVDTVDNSGTKVGNCNRPEGSKVLPTIDDSGTPSQTRRYLDVLEKNNMKAVFFLQGSWAVKHPGLVAKIKRAGHTVGNHGMTHAALVPLLRSSRKAFDAEIAPPKGVANTNLYRPAFGNQNAAVRKLLAKEGMQVCGWKVDTHDWDGSSTKTIMHRLKKGDVFSPRPVAEGDIVLFHIHSKHGAQALNALARYLRAKHIAYEPLKQPRPTAPIPQKV